jgi:3-dehydroquinate dehydratase / shikimate dehydrogenase
LRRASIANDGTDSHPRSEPPVTHLCVPIFVMDLSKARRDVAAAVEAGADMIELRVDRLHDLTVLEILLNEKLCKTIVTNRTIPEGGFWPPEDEIRSAALMDGPAGRLADYLDLELSTFRRYPGLAQRVQRLRATLIFSIHDLAGRPVRLYNIIDELDQLPGIAKIVWTARTIRDNLEAFEILQNRQNPAIALCMGEAGIISRILAKKFGSFLTFASLNRDESTAPGQISIAEMKNLYRWDDIRESTRVYGVVAHPVGHSMSPAIHNAAFDDVEFDGVYLPLLVEPNYESFKAFMETFLNFPKLDLRGLSVTIPHKEHALKYLREKGAEVEALAERIGAVNTICVDSPEKLRGSNTDYAAILDCITSAANIDRDGLKDLKIGIIGAGGTGRTAVAALAHFGAMVLVCNRTHDRAAALAQEFDGKRGKVSAASLAELDGCDVWMNTSSVGMHPRIDENPLGTHQPKWTAKTIVFDAVYNPMKTKFLARAEEMGAKTIGGVEMFVRQAAGQFETWTGKPAPTEIMRAVIENRLGKK